MLDRDELAVVCLGACMESAFMPVVLPAGLKPRYKQCLLDGAASVAKVVVKPNAREDNWTVQEVGLIPQMHKPLIVLMLQSST